MLYLGSKKKVLPFLLPAINKVIRAFEIDTYIEPFCGGANVIERVQCKNKYAYDKSKSLIELIKMGLHSPQLIPESITKKDWECAKKTYRELGTNKISEDDFIIQWWHLGAVQYFGSFGNGGFSNGYADPANGRDHYKESYKNFMKQIRFLRNIHFEVSPYSELEIPPASMLYCDPPNKRDRPIGYTFENQFNHTHFWDWVRENSLNSYILVTEKDVPNDFEVIWEKRQEKLAYYKNGLLSSFDF